MTYQRKEVEKFGIYLARGVFKEVVRWAFIILIATAVFNWLSDHLGITKWDNTDNRSAYEHSGMKPLIDAATGCQYLRTADGALTARMGADGHQMCLAKHLDRP